VYSGCSPSHGGLVRDRLLAQRSVKWCPQTRLWSSADCSSSTVLICNGSLLEYCNSSAPLPASALPQFPSAPNICSSRLAKTCTFPTPAALTARLSLHIICWAFAPPPPCLPRRPAQHQRWHSLRPPVRDVTFHNEPYNTACPRACNEPYNIACPRACNEPYNTACPFSRREPYNTACPRACQAQTADPI